MFHLRKTALATVCTLSLVGVASLQLRPLPAAAEDADPWQAKKAAPPITWEVGDSLDGLRYHIRAAVLEKLETANAKIRAEKQLTPAKKKRLEARLQRVGDVVRKYTEGDQGFSLKQLENLGEEIGDALEGIDEEYKDLFTGLTGGQIVGDGKFKVKNKGQGWSFAYSWDDDAPAKGAVRPPPGGRRGKQRPSSAPAGIDMSDLDLDADVDALDLRPDQRQALRALVDAEERVVTPASKRLDQLGEQLRAELESQTPRSAEIERLVDAMGVEEVAVRKAKLRSWTGARAVLDEAQRALIR